MLMGRKGEKHPAWTWEKGLTTSVMVSSWGSSYLIYQRHLAISLSPSCSSYMAPHASGCSSDTLPMFPPQHLSLLSPHLEMWRYVLPKLPHSLLSHFLQGFPQNSPFQGGLPTPFFKLQLLPCTAFSAIPLSLVLITAEYTIYFVYFLPSLPKSSFIRMWLAKTPGLRGLLWSACWGARPEAAEPWALVTLAVEQSHWLSSGRKHQGPLP